MWLAIRHYCRTASNYSQVSLETKISHGEYGTAFSYALPTRQSLSNWNASRKAWLKMCNKRKDAHARKWLSDKHEVESTLLSDSVQTQILLNWGNRHLLIFEQKFRRSVVNQPSACFSALISEGMQGALRRSGAF